jgi:hypothetical protein
MKKALALLPLLVLLSAASWGASTDTPTSTLTPTPTYTPTPIAARDQRKTRVYLTARDVRASDNISIPATTPVANGVWLAQDNNMGVFAMGVPTPAAAPQVRINWTVPQDYDQRVSTAPQIWITGVNSTAITTTTMVCNVYRMRRAGVLSNYTGVQTMTGVTTNVQTLPNSYNLAQVTYTAKRFKLVMPTAVTQVAAGDELCFEIARVGGTGNLKMYTVEVEYARRRDLNP